MTRPRLGIVATHPIQYQIPWFREIAARRHFDLKVYYAILPNEVQQGIGFGVPFRWDIPMLEGYSWEVLKNTRSPARLGSFLGLSTPGVVEVFGRDKPDAVIITGWNALPLLQAFYACLRLQIPRLVRAESNALKARPPWTKALHRGFLSQFDACLAIGKANRAFYQLNGVEASRIFQTPYFVDNERFALAARELEPQREALRQDWHVQEAATCILFAGKLETKKRILDLIRAVRILKSNGWLAHLLVAGNGLLLDEARVLVAETGISATFLGFLNQTELPRAYVAADCLVLPSDYGETWGLVVNEAMACGLPAVVSDRVGCGPDLIQSGVTGMTFPFGNIEALAHALQVLCSDRAASAAMGLRARSLVAQHSAQAAAQGTIDAVEYVLRKRGAACGSFT